MARIRSIKPDFFVSETIAALPLSARLTFIGLWTHVDDNGVTIDNARLINAALWPLEEDPLETLQRTREDLRRLSEAGLIQRYEHSGRRYLFVSTWDEHQRVSHPSKPRYPRPDADGCTPLTSDGKPLSQSSGESPESLQSPPETLGPEQGAGSREKGYTSTASRPRRTGPTPGSDDDPQWCRFWAAFPRKDGKKEARAAWAKAVKKTDPEVIITGAERYRDRMIREGTPRPKIKMAQGWLNGERWEDESGPHLRAVSGGWMDN